jgi:transcription initiation factor TFIIE subunit alpha
MLSDPRVQEILIDITQDDESSNSIIECILNGTTSDLEISIETGIKLTIVRKILYKLYDAGLATCKKNKDPETKWEIYNWKFEPEKVSNIITKKYEKFSEDIQRSIGYEEQNMFFVCKANGHRYKFEKASENNFACPKCGKSMEYQDNSAIIANLEDEKATYVSMGELKEE